MGRSYYDGFATNHCHIGDATRELPVDDEVYPLLLEIVLKSKKYLFVSSIFLKTKIFTVKKWIICAVSYH